MATITWQTPAGNLGSYPAGTSISFQFVALSDDVSSIVTYKFLSGNLPNSTGLDALTISLPGYLTGTFDAVDVSTTSTFTIRAFDQFGNIRDRTFSITVSVNIIPAITTVSSGRLFSVNDSTWVDYAIPYANSVDTNIISITNTSGNFPPGLYIQDNRIKGYATPPFTAAGSPIIKSYIFTLQLESDLGNDSKECSIEIINQQLSKPIHNRTPAIVNSKPPEIPKNNDPFYAYYLSDNLIPQTQANEYFTFKVLGKDFEEDTLVYSYSTLPPGLSGDPVTGWITGYPIMNSVGVSDFSFSVSVAKYNKPLVTSPASIFSLRVLNQIEDDIVWVTPEDLGSIYNHTVSELFVKATSELDLTYSLASGNLPANLVVTNDGVISGRVAYQPADIKLSVNDETTYQFTIQVYSAQYPRLRKFRTFKLTVVQYYNEPVETLYFKASPSIPGREALAALLSDTVIPNNYVYRPDDIYFGKSTNVTAVQAYGIPASKLQDYLSGIQTNHYTRQLGLTDLKTAIARDENGDIIYEVVYSELVDDLINPDGVSIPESIRWERPVSLNLGPWTVNNSDIYSSYSYDNTYYTSLSPGSVRVLYPGSLDNMRSKVIQSLGQNSDPNLLPTWMTSQQENGNTLGFIRCWVICYTLPGMSSTVKQSIEDNWEYQLSDIDITIDRYYVDKSSTYNWNLELTIPAWIELPSEVTDHTNLNKHDLPVLFPRKTILPK